MPWRAVAVVACAAALAACNAPSSERAASTTTPQSTTPSSGLVTVYVATHAVPRCSSADELLTSGAITVGADAVKDLPPGVVTDVHQLAGRFTTTALAAGQPVRIAELAFPPFKGC